MWIQGSSVFSEVTDREKGIFPQIPVQIFCAGHLVATMKSNTVHLFKNGNIATGTGCVRA
jgi:hypothetical protein